MNYLHLKLVLTSYILSPVKLTNYVLDGPISLPSCFLLSIPLKPEEHLHFFSHSRISMNEYAMDPVRGLLLRSMLSNYSYECTAFYLGCDTLIVQ